MGSRGDYTTFYRDRDNRIFVKCGCFNGSLQEFLKEVEETHGNNHFAQEYIKAAEFAQLHIRGAAS